MYYKRGDLIEFDNEDDNMKKYIKNYMKHHNIGEQDIVYCEECGKVAVDIHHKIKKSQGGSDDVSNLQALCRRCHECHH